MVPKPESGIETAKVNIGASTLNIEHSIPFFSMSESSSINKVNDVDIVKISITITTAVRFVMMLSYLSGKLMNRNLSKVIEKILNMSPIPAACWKMLATTQNEYHLENVSLLRVPLSMFLITKVDGNAMVPMMKSQTASATTNMLVLVCR